MPWNDRHVNGPAIVQVKFQTGAWQRLCVAQRQINVNPRFMWTPLISDEYGEQVSADEQYDGVVYDVDFVAAGWDNTLVNQLNGIVRGRTEGQLQAADIGTLAQAGGHLVSFQIEATARTGLQAEPPWQFPACVMKGAPIGLGTRYSTRQIQFTAYPWPLGQPAMIRSAA